MRFAGCVLGGTDEARGCGSCEPGLGRVFGVGGSSCGVDCHGASCIRCTTGGSSMV